MIFGREIKAPGDWQLELAGESPDDGKNGPELNRSEPFEDSPVELDDAPVVGMGYPVVSSPKAPSTHMSPESPGKGNLSVGDWMAERADHPQPTCNQRPSRGKISSHLAKLRALFEPWMRENMSGSGNGRRFMSSGWWTLLGPEFAERLESSRAKFSRARVTRRDKKLLLRVLSRRAPPAYPCRNIRDGPRRFQRPAVQPQAQQPVVQPQAQQPVDGTQEQQQLAVMEQWTQAMEVTPGDPSPTQLTSPVAQACLADSGGSMS
ncbi:hypothetical protein QTP88_019636 [Uroleucon formosanum]